MKIKFTQNKLSFLCSQSVQLASRYGAVIVGAVAVIVMADAAALFTAGEQLLFFCSERERKMIKTPEKCKIYNQIYIKTITKKFVSTVGTYPHTHTRKY